MMMLIYQYLKFCIYFSASKTNINKNKQENLDIIDL